MNEKEYYSRMDKINGKLSTDRCSFDEVHNLTIQKNYLNKQYIKYLEHNWNELKKYIKEKLENANTYIINQNCKPQGDLGMQYYKAEFDKWRLEKVLSKIKELEEGGNNENN